MSCLHECGIACGLRQSFHTQEVGSQQQVSCILKSRNKTETNRKASGNQLWQCCQFPTAMAVIARWFYKCYEATIIGDETWKKMPMIPQEKDLQMDRIVLVLF